MKLSIPKDADVVPGIAYSGFSLILPSDQRTDGIDTIQSGDLFLAHPSGLVYNDERQVLNTQGIILGIGLAFALRTNMDAVPPDFMAQQRNRPVRLLTSTKMISMYDKRIYIAYFYFDAEGQVQTSFIGDDWGSEFPSPAIPTR